MNQTADAVHRRERVVGVQRDLLLGACQAPARGIDTVMSTTDGVVDLLQVPPDTIVVCAQPSRVLEMLDCCLIVAEMLVRQAKIERCLERVRIQPKRLFMLADSLVIATEVAQDASPSHVRHGQGRVKRERLLGRRQPRLLQLPATAQGGLTKGYQGPGAGVVRIYLKRALPEPDSHLQVLRAMVVEMIPALQIHLVGCGIAR